MANQPATDTGLKGMTALGSFYTTKDVANMLHISQRLVQVWVHTGQLRAARFGTVWRVSHADLEAFVTQASAQAPQAE